MKKKKLILVKKEEACDGSKQQLTDVLLVQTGGLRLACESATLADFW